MSPESGCTCSSRPRYSDGWALDVAVLAAVVRARLRPDRLAWLSVVRHGLHPVTFSIVINGQRVDSRPLNSAGGVALAFALIAMLGSHTVSVRRKIVFGAAPICTLVVVQQRTVWAVLAVTFLIWAAASLRRHGTARHRRLAATGVAVLGMMALALAGGVATGNVFDRSLSEVTRRNSSFQWRLAGWTDLLHSDHSAAGIAVGFPFGSGYRRVVEGVVTTVSPHSFYVETYLRVGMIGLIAFAFLYWNVWKYRDQAASALGISPLTVALLLVGLLVFSFTYEPGFLAAAVIAGLLVWEPGTGGRSHCPAAAEEHVMTVGRVVVVGPASPASIATHLSERDCERAAAIKGSEAPVLNSLVSALLKHGLEVELVTLTQEITRPLHLSGPGLTVRIGPYRTGRARYRAMDFFAQERRALTDLLALTSGDVVHAHWTYEFALSCEKERRPVLVTAHDAPLTILRLTRDAYRLVRAVLAYRVRVGIRTLSAVSPYLAQRWRTEMIYRRPIMVVPNIAVGLPVVTPPAGSGPPCRARRF